MSARTMHRDRMTFGVERLGALSDGVIAIGATLLVIDLKITGAETSSALTWADLIAQGPNLLAWAISFLMICVIWWEQHFALAQTERTDAPVIVATLAQLALVSLIPFSTSLIAFYEHSPPSAVVFSAVMTANGLALALHGWLIGWRPHLHKRPEALELVRHARWQLASYPATGALAIGLTYVHHPLVGVAVWMLLPILLCATLARRRSVALAGGSNFVAAAK
jgi:uncharacterized membrane protein